MGQERILDTRGSDKGTFTERADLHDLTSEVPDVEEALAAIDKVLKRSRAAQKARESRSCCGKCCD